MTETSQQKKKATYYAKNINHLSTEFKCKIAVFKKKIGVNSIYMSSLDDLGKKLQLNIPVLNNGDEYKKEFVALTTLLDKFELKIVPTSIPVNIHKTAPLYVVAKPDLYNDPDCAYVRDLIASKKPPRPHDMGYIYRMNQKLTNYNIILRIFEGLYVICKNHPLGPHQSDYLHNLIDELPIPKGALHYVKSLYSFANTIGAYQVDFSEEGTCLKDLDDERTEIIINHLANLAALSTVHYGFDENYPHIKQLKKKFLELCPNVTIAQTTKQDEADKINANKLPVLTTTELYAKRGRDKINAEVKQHIALLKDLAVKKELDERPFDTVFKHYLENLATNFIDEKAYKKQLKSELGSKIRFDLSKIELVNTKDHPCFNTVIPYYLYVTYDKAALKSLPFVFYLNSNETYFTDCTLYNDAIFGFLNPYRSGKKNSKDSAGIIYQCAFFKLIVENLINGYQEESDIVYQNYFDLLQYIEGYTPLHDILALYGYLFKVNDKNQNVDEILSYISLSPEISKAFMLRALKKDNLSEQAQTAIIAFILASNQDFIDSRSLKVFFERRFISSEKFSNKYYTTTLTLISKLLIKFHKDYINKIITKLEKANLNLAPLTEKNLLSSLTIPFLTDFISLIISPLQDIKLLSYGFGNSFADEELKKVSAEEYSRRISAKECIDKLGFTENFSELLKLMPFISAVSTKALPTQIISNFIDGLLHDKIDDMMRITKDLSKMQKDDKNSEIWVHGNDLYVLINCMSHYCKSTLVPIFDENNNKLSFDTKSVSIIDIEVNSKEMYETLIIAQSVLAIIKCHVCPLYWNSDTVERRVTFVLGASTTQDKALIYKYLIAFSETIRATYQTKSFNLGALQRNLSSNLTQNGYALLRKIILALCIKSAVDFNSASLIQSILAVTTKFGYTEKKVIAHLQESGIGINASILNRFKIDTRRKYDGAETSYNNASLDVILKERHRDPKTLDFNLIHKKQEESVEVRDVIGKLRDENADPNDIDLSSFDEENYKDPTESVSGSESMVKKVKSSLDTILEGLGMKERNILLTLLKDYEDTAPLEALETLAKAQGLMSVSVCVELINDFTYEKFDSAVFDVDVESGIIYIDEDIKAQILEHINQ